MAEGTHYVYRCFDDRGNLLYIGCTSHSDVRKRLAGHRSVGAPWLVFYRRHDVVEVCPTRTAGLQRETALIEENEPPFNTAGSLHWRRRREDYLIDRGLMTESQRWVAPEPPCHQRLATTADLTNALSAALDFRGWFPEKSLRQLFWDRAGVFDGYDPSVSTETVHEFGQLMGLPLAPSAPFDRAPGMIVPGVTKVFCDCDRADPCPRWNAYDAKLKEPFPTWWLTAQELSDRTSLPRR